jgi:hypothetical protein
MSRSFIFFLLFVIKAAHADELYEFHRITCDPATATFLIEKTEYWNIRSEVWPDGYEEEGVSSWTKHVQAMREMEKTKHLYVLDEAYGHYDGPTLSFSCAGYSATIRVSKVRRDECEEIRGTGKFECFHYYRAQPRLTVVNQINRKTILKNLSISSLARLSITKRRSANSRSAEDLVCFDDSCLAAKTTITETTKHGPSL